MQAWATWHLHSHVSTMPIQPCFNHAHSAMFQPCPFRFVIFYKRVSSSKKNRMHTPVSDNWTMTMTTGDIDGAKICPSRPSFVYTNAHTYIHIHMHTHTRTHARTHTHTHTHRSLHIHAHKRGLTVLEEICAHPLRSACHEHGLIKKKAKQKWENL